MRKQLVTLHVVLAAFFLPIALMFLLTGALYTLSYKGNYKESTREITLAEPLPTELSALVAIVERELQPGRVPTGSATVRTNGGRTELEWTGANRDVSLKPTADPLKAQLTVKDTTIHRRLVQLHKAKGSVVSKTVSVVWSAGLLAMFVSGFAMAWAVPAYRRLAMVCTAAGLATFIAYVAIG